MFRRLAFEAKYYLFAMRINTYIFKTYQMAENSDIVKAYASMFNGYERGWKVSGTALPNYMWEPDGVKKETVTVGEGKDKETKTLVSDIDSHGVYAPFSLFSEHKLFSFAGIGNTMYGGTDSVIGRFNDDERARYTANWQDKEPTYQNIIDAYSNIEAARYKIQDFIYNKYYGAIPPNYLITLRRYVNPCDDIPFTLAWDEDTHRKMWTTSAMLPVATATTYMSEVAGNKLDDILKMGWNMKFSDTESEVQVIKSNTPGATSFGIGQRFDKKEGGHFNNAFNSTLSNLFTGSNYTYAQQTVAADYAQMDPLEKYSKFTVGPLDVIKNTKKRDMGLEFSHDFSLKFAYELKSLQYVNPKMAMLDIIANMIAMGTNSGTWWGGAIRYYGNGGGYGRQIGDPNLFMKGDYAGYFKSVAHNVNESIKGLNGGAEVKSFNDVINVIGSFLKGAAQNFLGSLINGKLGQVAAQQPAHALLDGAPTGYWHVTFGNPLNPIAMMGNMICKKVDMNLGGGLGWDDFPVECSFTCSMEHGKPRDAADIESMFNAGRGRIYLPPYLGELSGASTEDINKLQRARSITNAEQNKKDPMTMNLPKVSGGAKYSTDSGYKNFNNTIDFLVKLGR